MNVRTLIVEIFTEFLNFFDHSPDRQACEIPNETTSETLNLNAAFQLKPGKKRIEENFF